MPPAPDSRTQPLPLAPLDLQILMVLAEKDLYGYAIMKAVEEQSGGALAPEIGSLYRVLGRLMDRGWVAEADPPDSNREIHRGKPRKYYRLTERGLNAARAELRRLEKVVRHGAGLDPQTAG